jgi:hypothetical protein
MSRGSAYPAGLTPPPFDARVGSFSSNARRPLVWHNVPIMSAQFDKRVARYWENACPVGPARPDGNAHPGRARAYLFRNSYCGCVQWPSL